MAGINLRAFGYNEVVQVAAASKTLVAADSGLVQNVISPTNAGVINLPATVNGAFYFVRVGKEGQTINITPNGTNQMVGNGFTAAAGKGLVFTNQPAGSYVALAGDGTVGWYIAGINGTATRQP